ncbi:hypothetical protein GBAR_LOCUS29633 [Geodia barretti]|uniref:Uncharacterized protein n=1 Tax=Geodia barretti TaxID=519541 RepID=A0AA35TTM3_GEOBA|nr:hypothetical protein GBAR_LOCUS29633 [Geodia barretti]
MDYNNAVEEKGPQIPKEMVLAPPARSSTADLETVKEESPHGQEVKTGPASSLSDPTILELFQQQNKLLVRGTKQLKKVHSGLKRC